MKLRAPFFGIFGFILALIAFTVGAQAQATRTWVSGVGDDVNPCSRTAPCKTFAGAISKTAAGGEINCIDAGGFGAVTIVKSMTIDCANIEAGVVVAGTNGIVVSAGAADVVVLRGLDLMGTVATPGINGILFNTGGALHVEKCNIREFTQASPNGNGILFQPTGTSKLFVSDTVLTNNSGRQRISLDHAHAGKGQWLGIYGRHIGADKRNDFVDGTRQCFERQCVNRLCLHLGGRVRQRVLPDRPLHIFVERNRRQCHGSPFSDTGRLFNGLAKQHHRSGDIRRRCDLDLRQQPGG
jgi:hypothetical protein